MLKAAIQTGALPLLVVLFVAVGASLRLDTLAIAGVTAIGLAATRIALISNGVRAGLRAARVSDPSGEYIWTGLISQAGITLGLSATLAAEFPTWGTQVQMLLVALIAIDELIGPALFRTGLARSGRDRCHGAAPLAGRLQSRAVHAQLRRARADRLFGGDRRCRRGTGRVDARARWRVRDRPWWGDRRSPDHRRARQDCRAARRFAAYVLRRLWIPEDDFAAYYGGFANEGLWPFVSSRGRAPEVSNRRFGSVPEGEREVCRRHRRRDVRFRHRRVSSGLSPCDGGAVSAEAPAVSADRALLAHSVAEPGSASRVAVEAQSASRAAHERICWRSSSSAIAGTSFAATDEELGAEIEADGTTVRFKGHSTTLVSVPIGVDYDQIQAVVANRAG